MSYQDPADWDEDLIPIRLQNRNQEELQDDPYHDYVETEKRAMGFGQFAFNQD